MKKIFVVLLFVLAFAATPASASHHRRHDRYHGGRPIVVIRIPG